MLRIKLDALPWHRYLGTRHVCCHKSVADCAGGERSRSVDGVRHDDYANIASCVIAIQMIVVEFVESGIQSCYLWN